MRRAAQAATFGFAALIAFQAILAAGAPFGDAAWGGTRTHLTTAERIGSGVSVLVYVVAILVVRGRANGRSERRYRWGIWSLAALMDLSALANIGSHSRWENFLLAPVAVVLAVLCVIVARGANRRLGAGSGHQRPIVTPAH